MNDKWQIFSHHCHLIIAMKKLYPDQLSNIKKNPHHYDDDDCFSIINTLSDT